MLICGSGRIENQSIDGSKKTSRTFLKTIGIFFIFHRDVFLMMNINGK